MEPPDILNHTMPAAFSRAGYDTFWTCKDQNNYRAANKLFKIVHDKTMRKGTAERRSAWHSDRAIDFLNDDVKRGGDTPYLMYYAFSHPHDVRGGTPNLREKYGAYKAKKPPTAANPKAPPLPVSWLPEHPFTTQCGPIRDEVRVSGVNRSRTEAMVRHELAESTPASKLSMSRSAAC